MLRRVPRVAAHYKEGDTIRYLMPGGWVRIAFVLERRDIAPGFPGFFGIELDEDGVEVPHRDVAGDVKHVGCFGYDSDVVEVLVGPH